MLKKPFHKKVYVRYTGELGPMSQAERVIKRFGGAYKLAKLLVGTAEPRTPSSVYRWTYAKEKGGTGGVVPARLWPHLFEAARMAGILVTDEDTDPRVLIPQKAHPHDDTFE